MLKNAMVCQTIQVALILVLFLKLRTPNWPSLRIEQKDLNLLHGGIKLASQLVVGRLLGLGKGYETNLWICGFYHPAI